MTRFPQPAAGGPSRGQPPASVAATAGVRMGMRAARRTAASMGLHARGAVAPGDSFRTPKSPYEARDRVSPRRRLQPVRPAAPPDPRASRRQAGWQRR